MSVEHNSNSGSPWPTPMLRYVARLQYGESLPGERRDHGGKVLVYGSNGPVGRHDSRNTTRPAIVVGRKGSFGRVTWAENGGFVIDTAYLVDDRSSRANLRWLYYALDSLRLDATSQDTGVPGLSRELAHSTPVPTPPLPTQRAIADFLDRKTAAIDGLIAKKQKLLDLLAEKRTALINRAVTKGLDPDVPMKDSGVPWIGEIPAHWEVPQLGYALQRITYGFTSPMPTTDCGPYMLTANDIRDGFVDYEGARRTDTEAVGELTEKCKPRCGDVLVTKDGTLGRVAVAQDRPSCINQSVALLRPEAHRVSPEFLALLLRSRPYQERMLLDAGGTTIRHLYITRMSKMNMVLPPTDEQRRIAAFVGAQELRVARAEECARSQVEKLQEYRQALITAAVTGQIDVEAA